jgi:hypothetical protein
LLISNIPFIDVDFAETFIGGGCLLLGIEANGVATIERSHAAGCTYSGADTNRYPVTGSWSVYPRNASVITINLPKTIGAPTVPIDDTIKNTFNAGASLVVVLVNGKLMSCFCSPSVRPSPSHSSHRPSPTSAGYRRSVCTDVRSRHQFCKETA